MSLGLTQTEYAELVARTHAALGYGHLAARPEKVSRWENGRVDPDRSSQLAIARIHRVSPREVDRVGWPYWLHPAARRAAMYTLPWTRPGMVELLRSLEGDSRSARFPAEHSRSPVVTGPELVSFVARALGALVVPVETGREHPPMPGVVAALGRRVEVLEGMLDGTGADALRPVVAAELRLLAAVLAGRDGGGRVADRLLLLVSRVAVLGARIHETLGQPAAEEDQYLLAVRAAAAAGVPSVVGAGLAGLARLHERTGRASDARVLRRAAHAARRDRDTGCPPQPLS
ncbi:hypothetical protein [Streptomyces sp. TLI_053]|uniref:hypothetical protein n=1 Tax=Streptomyces sp. TLI_053 TaxID=1855352 RepID=UPI0013520A06|nr:hypothetical protein [Streptomyces sp. TLI_053]